jgi:(2Fe-2S) ferredoxin
VGVWTDSANDAERIAEAVLAGGRVVWTDKDFHVEM